MLRERLTKVGPVEPEPEARKPDPEYRQPKPDPDVRPKGPQLDIIQKLAGVLPQDAVYRNGNGPTCTSKPEATANPSRFHHLALSEK